MEEKILCIRQKPNGEEQLCEYVNKPIKYNDIAIFPRIDWYTAIFENISIVDLLDVLQFPFQDHIADIINRWSKTNPHVWGREVFIFDFGGFQIGIHNLEFFAAYAGMNDPSEANVQDLINYSWRWLRINISGSGLDMLRDLDCDVDTILRQRFELPEGTTHHVTRVDYAFDLVDYMPDLLETTYNCLERYKVDYSAKPGVKLGCCGTSYKGMNYEAHFGGANKTLYLGSTSSEKLLRMYDKKLQYSKNGKYDLIPYRDAATGAICNSWIRIELQLRKGEAQKYIYDNSFEQILLFIYEYYAPKEGRTKDAKPCPEWTQFWDWKRIPSIIQNNNFV